jgi:integrase/recombinase XerD
LSVAPIQGLVIFDRYEKRLESKGTKEHTRENFRRIASLFLDWLEAEALDFDTLTEDDVQRYFDSLRGRYAVTTIHHHRTHVSAALRYGFRKGWLRTDPTVDLVIPPKPLRLPETIEADDLRRIKTFATWQGDRTYLLFCGLAYTGCRRIELRRLRWQDVDRKRGTLYIQGKGDRPRVIPIHPILGEALARFRPIPFEHVFPGRNGGMMSDGGFFYQCRKLVAASGVEAKPHTFRRTVASSLHRNGVPDATIKALLGWSPDSIMAAFYLHHTAEDLTSALRVLYADDPEGLAA